MAKSYVLLDLESINVTTISTDRGSTIVFCNSIRVKKRQDQSFNNIKLDDWSNIIIGDSKYNNDIIDDNPNITNNADGSKTVIISTIDSNTGGVKLKDNIGLWSVILFTTKMDGSGSYTQLGDVISDSSDTGGSGTSDTGVTLVYYNTDTTSYVKYDGATVVDVFLKDVLGKTYNDFIYNGCIFIDNSNCGLFLNISASMFNNKTNLEKISLTNTIVYIDESGDVTGVFSNCNNLLNANIPKHLGHYQIMKDGNTIPNTDRVIPGYYFHNCTSLKNIIIPDGITQIKFSAFYGCDDVETIDIPSSVSSIYSRSLVTVNRAETRYINVHGDATDKTDITFMSKSVGYNIPLDNDPKYIPNAVIISITDRKDVTLLGSNISNDTSFVDNIRAGSNIYIDCESIIGVNIGSIVGSTVQFYQGGFIGTSFDTIYIGPSVKYICNFAFYGVKHTNLIINNAEVLKESYDDDTEEGSLDTNHYVDGKYLIKTPFVKSNFRNIEIVNCHTIGVNALHNLICTNLTFYDKDDELKINNSLTITNTTTLETLSDYAFYNSYFGSITIPSSVTNISNTSFLQTSGSLILNCDISDYETNINQNPRDGILINSGFSKINFNYAGIIPKNILYENKSINLIELGEGITKIHEKAFYLCTNLTGTLTIPSTLTQISSDAFIGCRFSEFETSADGYYQADETGMYLLVKSYFNNPNESTIVLFANRHAGIQIVDHTFDIINIGGVTGIGDYAFAYAFSGNSSVYAVNIPKNIKHFGSNVFYNSDRITRITFFASNVPNFGDDTSTDGISVYKENKENDFYSGINTVGSFVDLPLLTEVYVGYKNGVLLSDDLYSVANGYTDIEKIWFLHNTLRNSYTNGVPSVDGITIYVYKDLVDDYINTIWDEAGYTIAIIPDDIPSPDPPTENDDEYDADIDDPEGEEWPDDGGNGNISDEEDHIPPVDNTPTEEGNDNWVVPSDNNGFTVAIKQLGTPAINVYGCRLDLLNLTDSYSDERISPTPEMIVDQFGNIDFSALDYLKFNKVSNETHYGSENDKMLKLYMGDYGNNFLIVFTVTGIDKFDATTKLFTSGVEYATHRESNWLKTEIVRITKKPESDAYYVVLLCTCLKLQNKDNYNCRSAIVSVNYGSQILDTYVNGQNTEGITTKIRVIQHKTELRLSNDTKEINITDLPTLFCQTDERAEFFGYFFIGFPKNFWSIGNTINIDDTDSNKNKLREYINDYFRILYDKEKIKVIGQKTKIGELDYTYTFDVANDKYANIKSEGSTTGVLKKFDSCSIEELNKIHEEYYYVNFKIENLKTSLAGGVWNISIYNIGEPAEMLNIHAVEDKTDIPSISVMFDGTFDVENYEGYYNNIYNFTTDILTGNECHVIDSFKSVRMKLALPTVITGIPKYKKDNNTIKIYPSEELIDLCVDSSVVDLCGGSLLGNNMRGSIYNAFTTKINDTSLNLGISTNNILSTSLNNIKFTSTGFVKQSLYNYKTIDNIDRYEILQKCSRAGSLIKTQRKGDSENEILENTETYIYLIDTGYSSLSSVQDENTNKYYYDNYLSTSQGQLDYETTVHEETKLNSASVIDKLNEEIRHNEISETGVYIENNNILTDTNYNVLAPLYKYVYVDTSYNGVETIYINTNVMLSDDRYPTYYCTYQGDTYVVRNNNNVTNQVYILKNSANENVSVWNNSKSVYNCGLLDYELNKNVHAYECFAITYNSPTSGSASINRSDLDSNTVSKDYFGNIFEPNADKRSKIIKTYQTLQYSYELENKNVYKKDSDEYYDVDTDEKIDIKSVSIKIDNYITPQYYIYIEDNLDYESTLLVSTKTGNIEIDVKENNEDDEYFVDITNRYIKYDNNIYNKWYKIYNSGDIFEHYIVSDDFLINRDYNKIIPEGIDVKRTKTPLTNNKVTIIPKELSSIHPSLFRQIFYHLYYEINDNGKKIKVYDDNNNNAVIHLRLMNSYEYPTSNAFDISNIYGIKLEYSLKPEETENWLTNNIAIVGKPQRLPIT